MAITSEIARLIQEGGQIQGQGELQRGQIWGNFLTNLAGVSAQIQRAKTERQEQQVKQLELTERQRQLQEQAQVRGILTQYGGDFEKAQQALAQVSPEWGVKAQQIASDAQAHRWEFESKQRQHDAELMEMRGRLAGSVTPDTYPAFRQYVLKESPQDGAQLPIEWDPDVTPKILKGIQRKALTVAQQIQADEKEKADKRAEDAARLAAMREFALEQGKQAAAAAKLREPVKLGPGETLQQPQIDPATNAVTGYTPVATGGPREAAPRQAPATGSLEDYILRTYGGTPTPAQILQARKDYGQADDRPRVNVSVSSGDGLTPDAVDYTATAYRLLGTRGIPTRISGVDRAKILNAAAVQSKALGQSPATAVTRQLTVKADSAALNQIQKMSSSAEAFEAKALGQADIIADLSSKVPRTQFPLINAAIQSGRMSITGDVNATKLANAVTTFTAEYAKIMEGSTGSAQGSSDAARRSAERLLNTAMNTGTMAGVLDLMKKEMQLTIQGYDVAKEHITDRMGGAPAAPAAPGVERWERGADGKLRKVTK